MAAALTPILELYSLEILLLVASAAAAVSLVRVPPRGRLVLWRAVVIACLLLPLAPPRVVHVDLMPMATTARVINPGVLHADDRRIDRVDYWGLFRGLWWPERCCAPSGSALA